MLQNASVNEIWYSGSPLAIIGVYQYAKNYQNIPNGNFR